MGDAAAVTHVHEPRFGTRVEVTVVAADRVATRAHQVVADELERMEHVFSIHRGDSELCRWRRGEVAEPSADLATVLRAAVRWHAASGGAFHPASRALASRWAVAQSAGVRPSRAELRDLATTLADLPFGCDGAAVERTGDCRDVDLNAIAKGYAVDVVVGAAGAVSGVERVLVNAGGDLAHRGAGVARVGIENPLRPYDNEPPIAVVELRDSAIATSGSARRGWSIAGGRFGHVIDPRTGEPVDDPVSASVLATSAMVADAAATVLGVLGPVDGAAPIATFGAAEGVVGWLVVGADGTQHADDGWISASRR